MNNERTEKQLRAYIETLLELEYLGIRIEKTEDEQYSISPKTVYYYSVPESSTIVTKDEELKKRIQTSDELIKFGKEMILEMILNSCEAAYNEKDKWLLDEIKEDPSKYFKFRAKVRKGEIWNDDLGKARIKELSDQIINASGYKDV